MNTPAVPLPPPRVAARRDAARARLACIVPMYNEGSHARAFIEALLAVVAPRFAQVRIVVVNDGSRDNTGAEVAQAVADGLPVFYRALSRNFGKEVALTAGLEAAARFAPDAVLVIDSDFQHPLETVPDMIAHWEAGIDMAYGVQTHREQAESWLLRRAKGAFYRLMGAANAGGRFEIPRNAGDFRLFDRRVLDALNRLPERNRYMKGLYAWVGFSSVAVPFEVLPRLQGLSSFGPMRLMELALDGLTAFSHWPLRLSALIGFVVSGLALLYGGWIVVEWAVVGQEIEGFTTLAAALMFFSGIQLVSIGLLGEYIGRVFVEVKQRPLYVVGEDIEPLAPQEPVPPMPAQAPVQPATEARA
ncbi:MAG: putative glycosyltransferase [Paracidovorax wautersii]|uniref:Putative glycosyltransferase n=1 Tax=Paracidovorax wautersii TaxID=1177982 RepID=A0A7V8FSE2_9BURK|nr:MAG: putative glycosyltransferase [Paracidovorax wautersii]